MGSFRRAGTLLATGSSSASLTLITAERCELATTHDLKEA